MNRLLTTVCAALLSLPGWAQRAKPPGGGGGSCPPQAAQCSVSLPVFNFGRQVVNTGTAPINSHNTISITCTRSPVATGIDVTVNFTLKAEPAEPTRSMRDRSDGEYSYLRYFLYLDAARTRHWGDGIQYGTHAIQGTFFLDDRNRIGTLGYVIYGTIDGAQAVHPGPKLGAVLNRLQYETFCN